MASSAVKLTSAALPEELPPWGVLVRESHHARDFFMEWRTHPFLKVLYFRSGESIVHVGRKSFHCRAGDIVFVAPGTANRIADQPGRAVSLYMLCLGQITFEFDRRLFSSLQSGHWSLAPSMVRGVENDFRRLRFLQSFQSTMTSATMVSIALGVVANLLENTRPAASDESKPGSHEIIDAQVTRLENHFVEATGIEEAAAEAGMSRRYFTKLFRDHTGKSWLEYVHDLRIDHACELLRKTQLPVATIAFECGYNDLSTFYRAFGKRKGASPQEWREKG